MQFVSSNESISGRSVGRVRRPGFFRAVLGSLGTHLLILSVAAAWGSARWAEPAFLSTGDSNRLVLTVETAAVPPVPVEMEFPDESMQVTPDEARVGRRVYRRAPSSAVSLAELLAIDDLEADLSAEMFEQLRPVEVETEAGEPAEATDPPGVVEATVPPVPPSLPAERSNSYAETTLPSFDGNRPPAYPSLAMRNGWQGVVRLRLRVDEEGIVQQVWVVKSSGHQVLDAAAVNAVRGWRGQPARRGGQPIAGTWDFPIRFTLPR